jgi:hypothetical protein
MDTGLYRTELAGFAGVAHTLSGWFEKAKIGIRARLGLVWLSAILIVGAGMWMLLSGSASNTAESEPVRFAASAAGPSPVAVSALDKAPSSPKAAGASSVAGLRISSQSWRRGGLGSNALVTFTLRNRNDYAVKDIGINCAFTRKDGSHLTDRTRVIPDIVNMKSRRTFARFHVGFVNINASRAKCALVAASRI